MSCNGDSGSASQTWQQWEPEPRQTGREHPSLKGIAGAFGSGIDPQLLAHGDALEDRSISRITKEARPDASRKLQALKAISKQQPLQAWLHELCTALAPVIPEPFKGFIACSAAQARAVLLPSEFCAKY